MSDPIAFIPARGGSKRLSRKNLERIGPWSLTNWAVASAVNAGIRHVVVSTDDYGTECDALEAWHDLGLEGDPDLHKRKPEHATDTAQIEDALIDWASGQDLDPETPLVILQPTSPLRRPSTVRRCLAVLEEEGVDSVLTVSLDRKPHLRGLPWPGRVWRPELATRARTQDVPPVPVDCGVCYVVRWGALRAEGVRTAGECLWVPVEWPESLDVDTEADLELARALEEWWWER